MGLLVDGKWTDKWYDTKSTGGAFKRQESSFRNWVTKDGESGFPAEAGRYHLYVSLACPWAHRTLIFRKLKGLEDKITVSVVDPLMLEEGWTLHGNEPVQGMGGAVAEDSVNRKKRLYEVYLLADPAYTGRVTVPVLWDKKQKTIVTNESSEIIRMFNTAFDGLDGVNTEIDFYPEELRSEIDAINEAVYPRVNNGVYKAGFATAQSVYEEEVATLFDELDRLEDILGRQRYLAGKRQTEADWRLFTTLVRFDAVYHGHFKCNLRCIADYPNLSNYLRDLYQVPGVAETVDFNHIKKHYYGSHKTINPTGIVPAGPVLDLDAPHDRARFG